jgi:hypothetical protein
MWTFGVMMNMELISTAGLARSNGWNEINFKALLHEMKKAELTSEMFGCD